MRCEILIDGSVLGRKGAVLDLDEAVAARVIKRGVGRKVEEAKPERPKPPAPKRRTSKKSDDTTE